MKTDMTKKRLVKTIFCANCQAEQEHALSASPTGEVVATCSVCERILKFPAGISREDFDKALEVHKEANEGQVSQESVDATLAALAD
jgi:RNase P subunit RPR2